MNPTYKALLKRGMDSKTIENLISQKYTLTKLKFLSLEELIALGITEKIANEVLKESRPPIPDETVMKLLYDSKYCCCICRDPLKGIIIHHIEEWHISKSHDEENLIVLCTHHHDLAHTKKDLTLNLTSNKLREFKYKWINEVKFMDTNTILGLLSNEFNSWDYFNHNRIFQMYIKSQLSNENFRTTTYLQQVELINPLGTFEILETNSNPFYRFKHGPLLYNYMEELFNSLIRTHALIDLTDKFNRETILSLLNIGTLIALQAGFYFKDITDKRNGLGQIRYAHYKKRHIKIEFEFDAYETTSSSSWGSHLHGHKVATIIGYIKSIIQKNQELVITISCLAMGTYLNPHPNREITIN